MHGFEPSADLRPDIDRVRAIRGVVNGRISKIPKAAYAMDAEELADTSRMLALLECVLAKYQGKREVHRIMQDIHTLVHEAASGIEAIDDDMDELCAQSTASCRMIQDSRLAMHARPNAADRLQVRTILAQTAPGRNPGGEDDGARGTGGGVAV